MTAYVDAPRPSRRPFVVLAVLALLALVVAAGLKSRQDLVVARARETALREKIAATRERVGALDRRITRLRRDPVLLETLAREELGFVKPGDVVLLYPEPSAGEAAAGARPAGASPAGARIPAAAAAPAPPEP